MHLGNFDKRSGDWKSSFRKLVTGRLCSWGQIRYTLERNQQHITDTWYKYTPFCMEDIVQDSVVDVQCGYVMVPGGACLCGFGADGG